MHKDFSGSASLSAETRGPRALPSKSRQNRGGVEDCRPPGPGSCSPVPIGHIPTASCACGGVVGAIERAVQRLKSSVDGRRTAHVGSAQCVLRSARSLAPEERKRGSEGQRSKSFLRNIAPYRSACAASALQREPGAPVGPPRAKV